MVSETTIQALKKAGWYEGRSIDIDILESNLKKIGYEVYEPVKQFLKEFGMLKVIDPRRRTHDTTIIFDDYYRHDKIIEEEKDCGERLVLVGELWYGESFLFVSESGKMYCSTGFLGNNAWEGWDEIINNVGYFKFWSTLIKERKE